MVLSPSEAAGAAPAEAELLLQALLLRCGLLGFDAGEDVEGSSFDADADASAAGAQGTDEASWPQTPSASGALSVSSASPSALAASPSASLLRDFGEPFATTAASLRQELRQLRGGPLPDLSADGFATLLSGTLYEYSFDADIPPSPVAAAPPAGAGGDFGATISLLASSLADAAAARAAASASGISPSAEAERGGAYDAFWDTSQSVLSETMASESFQTWNMQTLRRAVADGSVSLLGPSSPSAPSRTPGRDGDGGFASTAASLSVASVYGDDSSASPDRISPGDLAAVTGGSAGFWQTGRTIVSTSSEASDGLGGDGAETFAMHRLLRQLVSDGERNGSLLRSSQRVLQLGAAASGQALSADALQALPKVRFDKAEQQSCAICLESYNQGELLTALSCNHFFHVDCVSRWLRRSSQCPLCRAPCTASASAS